MLQDGSYESAQVEWPLGHADAVAVDGVGHVQLQGDEVEAVDALPVVETSIDFVRVADEKGGVFVVHSTILFLIEQSASFCHRGFWLLGWRSSWEALDAYNISYWKRNGFRKTKLIHNLQQSKSISNGEGAAREEKGQFERQKARK